MKNFKTKFNYVFILFQYILLGTIISLGLFRWFLTIRFEIAGINEELFGIWLPMILPWIPILIWLRRRLWILTFKNDDKGRFFFQFLAGGCMMGPLIFSQKLMDTVFGEISELKTANEIIQYPKSKFFTIKDYQVLKFATATFTDVNTSGKHNQDLNFDYYFVAPIVSGDTAILHEENCVCWYEIKYHERVNNSLSDEEKEEKYKAFYDQHLYEFKNIDFHSAKYFEKAGPSDARDYGYKAIAAKTGKEVPVGVVILKPEEESISSRNNHAAKWLGILWLAGSVLYLFALVWPGVRHEHPEKD